MSNGFLGKTLSTAGNVIAVYKVPVTVDFASISIDIVNPTASVAKVRIYFSTSTVPGVQDLIEYDTELQPGEGLERSCKLLGTGETVFIRTDIAGVAVRVSGLESLIA